MLFVSYGGWWRAEFAENEPHGNEFLCSPEGQRMHEACHVMLRGEERMDLFLELEIDITVLAPRKCLAISLKPIIIERSGSHPRAAFIGHRL